MLLCCGLHGSNVTVEDGRLCGAQKSREGWGAHATQGDTTGLIGNSNNSKKTEIKIGSTQIYLNKV